MKCGGNLRKEVEGSSFLTGARITYQFVALYDALAGTVVTGDPTIGIYYTMIHHHLVMVARCHCSDLPKAFGVFRRAFLTLHGQGLSRNTSVSGGIQVGDDM